MRILIANDGFGDAGGVQVYLNAVMTALRARGHELAVAYCTEDGAAENLAGVFRSLPRFHVTGQGATAAFAAVREWAPDVCYSHNMDYVDVDRTLGRVAPLVKFMHGYFGTCIGGLKMHAFPTPVACDRAYGLACAGLYFPRRCGQMSPLAFLRQWRLARDHRGVRDAYAAIVVASEHMRREFVRSGADPARVRTNPLFPTERIEATPGPAPVDPHVVFLGRMTALKGGDLLIRAVHHAVARLGRPIALTMVGDGPARGEWESLAVSLQVSCTFTGWKSGPDRWPILERASLVAVPSIWPEPFGLVGLEAGALGVPAIAVNVGGIGEWLRDDVNGVSVAAPATGESFGEALAGALGDRDRLARLRSGALRVAREMTLDRHVDRLEAIFAQC
jgi:glycosyltransferase involved in cell wall biosynthesis